MTTDEFETLRGRLRAPCFVDEGWRAIVVDAVKKIEWLAEKDPLVRIEWHEIKEWNATLEIRYAYLNAGDDDMVPNLIADVVSAAKAKAEKTCIVCGKVGAEEVEQGEQIRMLCVAHRQQRNQHALTADDVVAAVKAKFPAVAAFPTGERSWRVLESSYMREGERVDRIKYSHWSEGLPEGDANCVAFVEAKGVGLFRLADMASHDASEELVRQAVEGDYERLELNRSVVDVAKGNRPGVWIVMWADGSGILREERWLECAAMPKDLIIETPRVQLMREVSKAGSASDVDSQ